MHPVYYNVLLYPNLPDIYHYYPRLYWQYLNQWIVQAYTWLLSLYINTTYLAPSIPPNILRRNLILAEGMRMK